MTSSVDTMKLDTHDQHFHFVDMFVFCISFSDMILPPPLLLLHTMYYYFGYHNYYLIIVLDVTSFSCLSYHIFAVLVIVLLVTTIFVIRVVVHSSHLGNGTKS